MNDLTTLTKSLELSSLTCNRTLSGEYSLYHAIKSFCTGRTAEHPTIDDECRCAFDIELLAEQAALNDTLNWILSLCTCFESWKIRHTRLGCKLTPPSQAESTLLFEQPIMHHLKISLLACTLGRFRSRFCEIMHGKWEMDEGKRNFRRITTSHCSQRLVETCAGGALEVSELNQLNGCAC
jgi:hypothetical protein